MRGPRVRLAALVAFVMVLAAAAAVGGYAETRAVRDSRPPARTPGPAPSALLAASAPPSAPATSPPGTALPTAVTRRLSALAAAPALAGHLLAQVLDAQTGTVLYGRNAGTAGAPASTTKVLTATAVLTAYPATQRFATTVVSGPGGEVVLVGGGDPTLTAAPRGQDGAYPDAGRIADLAAQLTAAHVHPSRIVVDGSLFTGPSVSPAWDPGDVPSSYGAPITALMIDGGRAAPRDPVRSAEPELAAGHALARALGTPGLPVVHGTAAAGATRLAAVQSAPLAELVAQMLQASDNVLADVLARHVAIARGLPASFAGAVTAIRAELAGLGITVSTPLHDGSGLAASDRLSPAVLAAVLRAAAGGAHPELHDVLAGLPVTAWSGTLADRYLAGSGAGSVRAKTGTLTGVASLAGVVHTADGNLLAFAFIANGVPSTTAADHALDALASALAACGCD